MKTITIEDCENLYKEFLEYTETAEQHEFYMLAMINCRLDSTINNIRNSGVMMKQREARAMFRTVYKVIGKDSSAYAEPEYNPTPQMIAEADCEGNCEHCNGVEQCYGEDYGEENEE